MVRVLLLAIILALPPDGAGARDYRDEIMQYVIDPCYLTMAAEKAPERVSATEFARLAKMINPKPVNDMVDTLNNLLRKYPDFSARRSIYKLSLAMCLGGATKK